MATERDVRRIALSLPEIKVGELRELIMESWRLKAPKRVLQKYERELFGDPE